VCEREVFGFSDEVGLDVIFANDLVWFVMMSDDLFLCVSYLCVLYGTELAWEAKSTQSIKAYFPYTVALWLELHITHVEKKKRSRDNH
jgi:hypothetical protein